MKKLVLMAAAIVAVSFEQPQLRQQLRQLIL